MSNNKTAQIVVVAFLCFVSGSKFIQFLWCKWSTNPIIEEKKSNFDDSHWGKLIVYIFGEWYMAKEFIGLKFGLTYKKHGIERMSDFHSDCLALRDWDWK